MKLNTIWPVITEKETSLPFILKSIGMRENQEHIRRPSGFDHYHWLYCKQGKGKLLIDDKEYIIDRNTAFFFYPDIPHEYYMIEEPWETYYLTFSGTSVPSILEFMEIPSIGVYSFSNPLPLEKLMEEISNAATTSSPLRTLICSNLIYNFLIQFKTCIFSSMENKKPSKLYQLYPVISFIEDNFNSDMTLRELAKIINITPQYLCLIFKDTFQMRPFEYITALRIQKAKELLDTPSELNINEIARMVGYNDTSYFCHIFREHENQSPMEFKNRHYAY